MENLLKPDIGLMIWTVVTFLTVALILKKLAWPPLMKALDEREEKIRNDIEAARKNKEDMERLKADYDAQMQQIQDKVKEILAQAQSQGNQTREAMMKEAESDAKKLTDKTLQQLEAEKERLIRDLRSEVGALSVELAERLVKQTVDKKVQEKFVEDFLKELDSAAVKKG